MSTPAVVLRAINFGESDRVVTLLGRTTGRLSALARGARKSQKRFAGGLDLCSIGDAALRERHGAELLTLERFDLQQSYASLASDVARMAHAAYAAELVSKLCAPRQAEVDVYDWLLGFLRALDRDGAGAERLRIFELGLLGRLGFGPMVETCAVCGGTQFPFGVASTEVGFRWDPSRGGAICSACGNKGRPIRPVVRLALARWAGAPVDAPAGEPVALDVNRGARDAIAEVLKLHMSGPLQSLEFMAKMGSEI